MHTPFKLLLKDRIIFMSFWSSVILFAVAGLTALVAYPHFPPFLPLYNKLAWGYARLGHTYEIVIPFGLPLLLSALNILLAKYFYEKTPLLARLLLLITFLLALFTFVFIIKLTLIIL